MATNSKSIPQDYPRIYDGTSKFHGCVDDNTLVAHKDKLPIERIKELIATAIVDANKKSSRAILDIPSYIEDDKLKKIYHEEGIKLFKYFRKYVGDPAATAHQIYGKHYASVGKEQFRNRTLQKERMNSGWRYQFLLYGCARESSRFNSVSDLGLAEADMNVEVAFVDSARQALSLYVSVKNRSNTMGGQDWPKAINALENFAKADKNRKGPYLCVFGIAMERGKRLIKSDKTGKQYSTNTELWLSDFLWPFFSNYQYEEIMNAVLDVLVESFTPEQLASQVEIPDDLIKAFGEQCFNAGLTNSDGIFNDHHKLVNFFCGSSRIK